jgi:release factor glutamine methyltransferase
LTADSVHWRAVHHEAARRLGGSDDARREARWLCQDAAGADAAEWVHRLDEPATAGAVARVDALVARRAAGEPLQYVLGHWPFRHLDLFVDRRVLIPRPETEQVAEVAIDLARAMRRPLTIVDLGTGSGAIALSLAAELPLVGVEVWASDVDPAALDVARANLAGLGRRAANVRLVEGSWYDALPDELRGRVALVVANPPYVATTDALPPEVGEWEPPGALYAGETGLDAIKVIVSGATRWLAPGGSLVVEIGAVHGAPVTELARAAGLVDVSIAADLAGRDRILVARSVGDAEGLAQERQLDQ